MALVVKDLIDDFGAVGAGDYTTATRTVTTTSGSKNVSVTANTFVPGDAGKFIYIPGLSANKIGTVTDAQNIVLTNNADASLSGAAVAIEYGTDDAPAFTAFNVWALANQGSDNIKLVLRTGKNFQILSDDRNGISRGAIFASGVKNLLVYGYGATLSCPYVNAWAALGAIKGMSQRGIAEADGASARVQTVAAGATSVTLTAASLAAGYASRFTVGQYANMTGLDLQGLWNAPYGFPCNVHFFEYVQITAVDAITGKIDFTPALTNSYKDYWPNYNDGNASEVDAGGPATLYALHSDWNCTLEYQGLTIDQTQQDIICLGRAITFRDCVCTSGTKLIPTQNELYSVYNVSMPGSSIEIDKLIKTMVWDNSPVSIIQFQSSSTDLLTMTNTTVGSGISGTPKVATFDNCTIAGLQPGCYVYGRSDETTITNSVVSSFVAAGALDTGAHDGSNPGINIIATMAAGIISWPNTRHAPAFAVPGTYCMWNGAAETETLFKIIDVTQDATTTYIQTDLAGGFPAVPLGGGKLNIRVHPAPRFTARNSTGCAAIVDLCQAPARAPLYSYSFRTYDGLTNPLPSTSNDDTGPVLWGALRTLKVNVSKAYSGTNGNLQFSPTRSDIYTVIEPDYSAGSYIPGIKLNTLANRIIAPGSVQNTQSGDSGLDPVNAVWMTAVTSARISANITGEASAVYPSFTVEWTTDQGIPPAVPTAVMPLRFRLHA